MLDTDRLQSFMHTFYGYGTWKAPLWFVGMEEGGGAGLNEIASRLAAWDGSELMDIRDFHRGLQGIDWFRERPPLQSTWSKLIRVALCAEAQECTTEAVRRYQRDELAGGNGRTAVIELLPLPSRSVRDWIYGDLDVPELANRSDYSEQLKDERIETIRSRIDEHHPAAIVFYGLTCQPEWQKIAESRFVFSDAGYGVAQRGPTRLFLARHPVAPGACNEEFCAIGRDLAGLIDQD